LYQKPRLKRGFYFVIKIKGVKMQESIFDSKYKVCLTRNMNSTGLVGGIATLMIFAAGFGGPNGFTGAKASAFEASRISQIEHVSTPKSLDYGAGASLNSDVQNGLSRHVQIVIDGKVYSGTLFAEVGAQ
jgi:hypothetical protein